jgi:uncharacterized membrane protein YhaH (DUF805 family)
MIVTDGRAGRLEWWFWFFGANMAGARTQEMLISVILTEGQRLAEAALPQVIGLAVGAAAIMAVVMWVQMTATVRRAHDRDSSSGAFWAYALVIVAFAVSGFTLSALDRSLPFNPAWASWLPLAATAWMVIQFGFRPGDPMPNRWGPVPKPLFGFSSPKPNNYRPPHI